MSEEYNVRYRQAAEVWNTGNVGLLDEFCAPTLLYHIAPFPDMNVEALKQFIGAFRMAFPDFHVDIEEDLIAGNRSAHRWTCSATFTGQSPLLPVPPTGKRAIVPGSHIVHWEEGKAVEMWHFGDWMGYLQQVGIIPPLG